MSLKERLMRPFKTDEEKKEESIKAFLGRMKKRGDDDEVAKKE